MRKEEIYRAAENHVGYISGFYSTEQVQSMNDFKAGAEWAEEKSYSEKEVYNLLYKLLPNKKELDEWFEYFKKKFRNYIK